MQIPIEIRDNKDVAGSETFDTFVKIEFIEMPEMIPAAIQVNGKWFIPADGSKASAHASTWESLISQPCNETPLTGAMLN